MSWIPDLNYRPRLRHYLAASPEKDYFILHDQRPIGQAIRLSREALELIQRFNGKLTIQQLHEQAQELFQDQTLPIEMLVELVQGLEEALLLHGPKLEALLEAPEREPSCLGVYSDKPEETRAIARQLFTAPGGPGMPGPVGSRANPRHPLKAVLVPHMDYTRGNITYGWGFKELFERTTARLFVIIATSHYSPALFNLSRQNFRTTLGTVQTDQRFIDHVVEAYGHGLFSDPEAHIPEHSIELEVLLLQFLYEDVGPIRIVPLLVGSYHESIEEQTSPSERPELIRLIQALKSAEAAAGEGVCYIISGDLAHIGPKFDDPEPVSDDLLNFSKLQDERLMVELAQGKPEEYYRIIADEQNDRRICGLPPTYLTLLTAQPKRGQLLHYQQYVHPQRSESVSFASVVFEG